MIDPKKFYNHLSKYSNFISGVPDSLLKELNACILKEHPNAHHIIAPNEGLSIALGIGNYISTGKTPLIYMQNSGIGNAINPLLSLADKDVYGIPMLILIGWRGEPGEKDEPQHFKQGMIQEDLLKSMQIEYKIIDSNSNNYENILDELYEKAYLHKSPKVLLVRKGTFSNYLDPVQIINHEHDTREQAISNILDEFRDDSIFVGTTGKAARELFELRKSRSENHVNDFLTVGGMGHASSIAAGISISTNKKVICIDGDGALLMHMGGLVSNAEYASKNFIHFVLNNGVHESVGGQPTLISRVRLKDLAKSCGYNQVLSISSKSELKKNLATVKIDEGPTFIEYKINSESRKDLGRPTQSPKNNLDNLVSAINEK